MERGTVTGELRAIDFANKRITILHPVELRELECSYSITDEVALINQRLSLVHVTGRLIRDASGRIASIDEVDRIEIFDASPIEIGRIETPAGAIRPRQALRFDPFHDTEAGNQWMTVEDAEFGLLVNASTRGALVDALRDEIAFLWEQYVVDNTTPLSASGAALRESFSHRLRSFPMPRAKRVVETALQNKGFRLENSHHRFFIYFTQQGEKTAVRTRTSQGGGEWTISCLVKWRSNAISQKQNFWIWWIAAWARSLMKSCLWTSKRSNRFTSPCWGRNQR